MAMAAGQASGLYCCSMKPTTAAYLAGIVDGEGSISLYRRKGGFLPYPVVTIDSIDLELLEFVVHVAGGNVVTKKRYKDHHSQTYSWRLVHRPAVIFLSQILAHLKINRKRRKAALLVAEWDFCTPHPGYGYTKQMREAKEDLCRRIQAA